MTVVAKKQVLLINASARGAASNTRALTQEILAHLQVEYGEVDITVRELAAGLPMIDEQWVNANFTAAEQRSLDQQQALALSDALIAELQRADIVVMGAPMYNFGVPASLKAWIDLVARAGVTFRYTKQGPVGLLEGKQAYVVVTTGGAKIGSAVDYASGYLKHVLGFIGIHDVHMIEAERYVADDDEQHEKVLTQIRHVIQVGVNQFGQVA